MSITEDFVIDYNETKEINSMFFETYEKLWLFCLPFDFSSIFLLNYYHPYVMSLLGSGLVGLSGILPFMVISLDESATFKTGTGAKTLRVLLSFAVGGLLGDVFLHLLPEAWENRHSSSDTNQNRLSELTCGLWVLAGLLIFIIVEKMFSFPKESEDKDDETCESSAASNVANKNSTGASSQKTMSIRRKKSSFILNDLTVNYAIESSTAKSLTNGVTNNNNVDETKIPPPLMKRPSSIHISGYLNLMANAIDNFTHGLAVGGSFQLSTRVGVLTTFAILIHEIPHEIGDYAILLRAGFSRWEAARAQAYTASAGIVGAFTALIFSASTSEVEARTSWILPFTAGGFLHIALVTVLPELLNENNPKESLKQLCSLASGITVMALLTALIEG